MHVRKRFVLILSIVIIASSLGCAVVRVVHKGSAQPTPLPQPVELDVQPTFTAVPTLTSTSMPTATPLPTETPTNTPAATETPTSCTHRVTGTDRYACARTDHCAADRHASSAANRYTGAVHVVTWRVRKARSSRCPRGLPEPPTTHRTLDGEERKRRGHQVRHPGDYDEQRHRSRRVSEHEVRSVQPTRRGGRNWGRRGDTSISIRRSSRRRR